MISLSNIEINGKMFKDGEKVLTFSYDIDEVIKHDAGYLVLYDYMQCDFNVDAYDLEGNKLWNINDILKLDYEEAFTGITKHDEMSCCYDFYAYSGVSYFIDITKKKEMGGVFRK